MFINSVMAIIHTNIERMERKESSVVEIRKILDRVISLLEKRITNNFYPLKVKTILKKLEGEGNNTREFSTKVKDFYNEINTYLKMWIKLFEDAKVFDWTDLTDSDLKEWSNVEKSLVFLKDHGIEINDEKLFDEWVNLKNCSENLNNTQRDDNLNFLGLQYLKQCIFEEKYAELRKVFCIPGHNANIERVFSLINAQRQRSKEGNRLILATVAAIIQTIYNIVMKREKCYDYLLIQSQILREINEVEKNKNRYK